LGLRWYVHNAYLWVWVMAGAVGLVPFLLLYGLFVIRGLLRWRSVKGSIVQRGSGTKAVVLGFTLGIVGQMIGNIVAPNFLQSWSLVIFAIILGANEVIYRLNTGGMAHDSGEPGEDEAL
jgi:O-antigen ligase